jgi:predicted nuclease of predicted toxin-antitoxin system
MRFKIDENLPLSLNAFFQERQLESESVHNEGLSGKPDAMIIGVCRKENMVLITMDIGFANQKVYPAGTHPGIIVVRIRNQGSRNVLSVIRRFLARQANLEELSGCTVIVEEHRIRIRRGQRDI